MAQKRVALIEARLRAKLSQRELAAKVGYKHGSMIWFLEAGESKPSLDKARSISNALNTPVEVLFPPEVDGHAEAS